MWRELFALGPVLPAAVMIVSDVRKRTISVGWLVVFALTVLAAAFASRQTVVWNMLQNTLLLGYLSAGILCYLHVRRKRWCNPLRGYIGTGDLLFMLCLTPVFDLKSYLIYLIASFLLSLAGWGLYTLLSGCRTTIPLVGSLGVVFILYTLFTHFFCR